MIQIIKKFIPQSIKDYLNNYRKGKRTTPKEIFTKYYKGNTWNSGESLSGQGSEIKQTKTIISELPKLLSKYKIGSILDIPCGDFNWMKEIDLSNISYTGADIVEDLVVKNNNGFEHEFVTLDLITDRLPKKDLVLVRDCFVHLTNAMIFSALNNIIQSESKYLLVTTFTNHKENKDIKVGEWRTLNFEEAPFHFPTPLYIINENCTEDNGAYSDKSLAMWNVEELREVVNNKK